jgi:tetratricopeptide (TPR) repeat protein
MNKIIRAHAPKWFVCFALALVTFAAYAPVARNNFINFDDPEYVTMNSHVQHGLSWGAVKWAFGAFHSANWHPLAWLSHMLDCQLYGLNPTGHHLTSLAFHIANTLLLFLLLQNLTARLWPSAFVALLFGIHPMHVESVAWVAERKDVLSALFFLLTLLAYARYVELTKIQSPQRWPVYGLTLLLFALGLMAKPMLVTLPCVLCLLDYWPLRRFQFPLQSQRAAVFRRLAFEKAPFFVLTAVSCVITFLAQFQAHSVKLTGDFPLEARLAHVPVAWAWYVGKLFWPANLSIYYLLLRTPHPAGMVVGALALMAILTWLAVWRVREEPYLIVGWLWFLVMLLPVSGLIQVGNQAYANRYTYLPYIGFSIALVWGLTALLAKWRYHNAFLLAGALLAATACFKLTVDQVRLWKNSQTLFERAIALDENNVFAWRFLGLEFMNQGNLDKAMDCLQRATANSQVLYEAWNDLGRVLYLKKEFEAAQGAYQTALLYAPNESAIYYNLGNLFMATGRFGDAITNYQTALELVPPDRPGVYKKLGRAFALHHQNDQAIVQFQNALRLQPNDADAELELAMALADSQQVADALLHYRRVLELAPDSVVALNNLSWLLATTSDTRLRDGGEAVRLAEHACQLAQYQKPLLLGTLAAAYAEAGRFNEAVSTAQEAHDLALAQGQKELAAKDEQLLELYKSSRAYHQ